MKCSPAARDRHNRASGSVQNRPTEPVQDQITVSLAGRTMARTSPLIVSRRSWRKKCAGQSGTEVLRTARAAWEKVAAAKAGAQLRENETSGVNSPSWTSELGMYDPTLVTRNSNRSRPQFRPLYRASRFVGQVAACYSFDSSHIRITPERETPMTRPPGRKATDEHSSRGSRLHTVEPSVVLTTAPVVKTTSFRGES